MIRLVIFDFDGVIADSESIALEELGRILAEHGLLMDQPTLMDRFLGASLASIVAVLQAETGQVVGDAFRRTWHDRLFARYRRELLPVPGIVGLLDALDAAGIDYCIASGSSPGRLAVALDCLCLAARFAGRAFSAEEVPRGKPAPDLMFHAAARRGVPPADCLVVEDAVAGVRAARAAGMRVIGFLGGSHLAQSQDRQGRALIAHGAEALVLSHAALALRIGLSESGQKKLS